MWRTCDATTFEDAHAGYFGRLDSILSWRWALPVTSQYWPLLRNMQMRGSSTPVWSSGTRQIAELVLRSQQGFVLFPVWTSFVGLEEVFSEVSSWMWVTCGECRSGCAVHSWLQYRWGEGELRKTGCLPACLPPCLPTWQCE